VYEQHRVHHVGYWPELEAQMVTWVPYDKLLGDSPDRLDALVYATAPLMTQYGRAAIASPIELPARSIL
jgi:phage terminase large subunit-like protein